MAFSGRIARSRCGLRRHGRSRRKLAGIAKGLATDAALAAKFAMFNALTKGEPLCGAEPLPRPGWRLRRFLRRRPLPRRRAPRPGARRLWRGRAVALMAMTAVLVGGLLLSLAVRPAGRTCMMLTSAGTSASAPAIPTSVVAAGRPAPVGGDHAPLCPAYPAKK